MRRLEKKESRLFSLTYVHIFLSNHYLEKLYRFTMKNHKTQYIQERTLVIL